MEALFVVLNHEENFNELLYLLKENEIHGGTILESQGLATNIALHDHKWGMKYLRSMINEYRPYNKTIFFVADSENIKKIKQCVHKACGNLDRENVGIMVTLPVSSIEGLTK